MQKIFDENGVELNYKKIVEHYFADNSTHINRVEVIDENGRSYVNWREENNTTISIQDEGRTLKVFIKNSLPNKNFTF
jgi:hypothetical protein